MIGYGKSNFTSIVSNEAMQSIFGHYDNDPKNVAYLVARFCELDADGRVLLFTDLAFEAQRQTSHRVLTPAHSVKK